MDSDCLFDHDDDDGDDRNVMYETFYEINDMEKLQS